MTTQQVRSAALRSSVSVIRETLPPCSTVVRLVQQVWKLVNALKRVRHRSFLAQGTTASSHTIAYPPQSADSQGDIIEADALTCSSFLL